MLYQIMPVLDLSKVSVLIVEDKPYMRQLLRTLVIGLGVQTVIEAEDGIAGIEALNAQNPDLLLTDWMMPIVNGIELTRFVRNCSEPLCFLPIIAVTAFSEKHHILEMRDAGVTEVLCKPISAKGLYQRIVNCFLNQRCFIRTSTFFGPDRRRFQGVHYKGVERRGVPVEDGYRLIGDAAVVSDEVAAQWGANGHFA